MKSRTGENRSRMEFLSAFGASEKNSPNERARGSTGRRDPVPRDCCPPSTVSIIATGARPRAKVCLAARNRLFNGLLETCGRGIHHDRFQLQRKSLPRIVHRRSLITWAGDPDRHRERATHDEVLCLP